MYSKPKLPEGAIDDPTAGLQWLRASEQGNMTWDQANSYVQNSTLAGGGWRLPTRAELKSLYSRLSSLGGKEVFINSGWWVWSSELKDSSNAWYFGFDSGDGYWFSRDNSYSHNRVLAVRSRR